MSSVVSSLSQSIRTIIVKMKGKKVIMKIKGRVEKVRSLGLVVLTGRQRIRLLLC